MSSLSPLLSIPLVALVVLHCNLSPSVFVEKLLERRGALEMAVEAAWETVGLLPLPVFARWKTAKRVRCWSLTC